MAPILKLHNITKRFPGVLANDHISLEIEKGEIHALLGENGAGKTTLMSILYGLHQPQEGEIYFEGRPVKISSSLEAIQLGIGMVHQHFMLIPVFTVAENVILSDKLSDGVVLNTDEAAKRIKELSKSYNIDLDPDAYIWQLPVGTQQRVEILKALYRNAKLLILDEPTAVLTPEEADALFIILRSLAEQGTSIIFISHKLNEVMAISNRVTVLRSGRIIDTVNTKDTNPRELAKMMVGREVVLRVERQELKEFGSPMLIIEGLEAQNDKGLPALKKLTFNVREGEIVGVAGVDGNGQKELAEVLSGLRKMTTGKIIANDINLSGAEPIDFIQAGIAYVPQDRKKSGSIGNHSIAENAILRSQSVPPFAKLGLMNRKKINQYADELIHTFDVRTPNSRVLARSLSGGNLQKLIIGREFTRPHKILIAMQPARGLDIAATEFVYNSLLEERRNGCAILLVSTELDEILALSDRVFVIYEGSFVGEMTAKGADIHEISLLMAGITKEASIIKSS